MWVNRLFSFQVFAIFLFCVSKNGCDGYCFVGPLMTEMTVSGRLRCYCEYTSVEGHTVKLLTGSNLYLAESCLDCKCTMDGLQCCGFGHAGGVIAIKDTCKMLLDGCQPLIVRKDNETIDCYTGKPINFTALSQQLPHPDNTYKSLEMRNSDPLSSSTAQETTTTTAAPVVAPSTIQPQTAHTGFNTPTIVDYFRNLMLTRTSQSNQQNVAPSSPFNTGSQLPSFNTGNQLPPFNTGSQLPSFNTGNQPPPFNTRNQVFPTNIGRQLQSFNTGSQLPSAPIQNVQQLPLANNFWQYDTFLPWYLFI